MKPVGFLLLLAGWLLAGFAIEVLGLALVFRANIPGPEGEK